MNGDNETSGAGERRTSREVRSGRISGRTFQDKEVRYSVIDGEAIFEGDIVLGPEDLGQQPQDEARPRGVAITGSRFRWPRGIVPFRIDPALPNQERVVEAIRQWERSTVIRFVQQTTELDFVTFVPGGGCSSRVGRIGGEQRITLGPNCTKGNAIHEIGHAVGLWHEQSREDRDNFVTIVFSNVEPNAIHNFDQHITDGDDIGAYDYGSVMHYPENAFAIDRSQKTIIAPRPIGQRDGLSAGDIAAVAELYSMRLRLQSLHCQAQEDFTGSDEAYLLVNGVRVWGPVNMRSGQSANLSSVAPIRFHNSLPIDLFDDDFPDADDHLGRTFARATQLNRGRQQHIFTGNGARYILAYEVVVA